MDHRHSMERGKIMINLFVHSKGCCYSLPDQVSFRALIMINELANKIRVIAIVALIFTTNDL